jgi:hypothetical protein
MLGCRPRTGSSLPCAAVDSDYSRSSGPSWLPSRYLRVLTRHHRAPQQRPPRRRQPMSSHKGSARVRRRTTPNPRATRPLPRNIHRCCQQLPTLSWCAGTRATRSRTPPAPWWDTRAATRPKPSRWPRRSTRACQWTPHWRQPVVRRTLVPCTPRRFPTVTQARLWRQVASTDAR